MSVREFVAALPKVELNLQLTGALRKESLLMVANQNGIPSTLEDFEEWLALLDQPESGRLEQIARMAGSWIMYPEDIALAVYDIGVALSKQNVVYAEVAVAPSDFVGAGRMNFDTFLDALNDGRDRASRAWNVDMAWILCIPRDNPRAGDDVARWATGGAARRGHVAAMGLLGQEDAQPIGQFRRAFATALKKDIFTVANAGSALGVEGLQEALAELHPHRLTDSWGIAGNADLLNSLAESGTPLVLSLTRAHKTGKVAQLADYPLKQLCEQNVKVLLSSGLPSLLQTNLTEEYVLAHEQCGLEISDLIELMRRSIELSFMDAEAKASLLRRFDFELQTARATYLAPD